MTDTNASTGHTPGPWILERVPVDHFDGGHRIYANGRLFAIMGDTKYYPWTPRNDADWLLIAAAPDLLAALTGLVSSLEDGETPRLDDALDAIAKARRPRNG
jgi:hypothetical protein